MTLEEPFVVRQPMMDEVDGKLGYFPLNWFKDLVEFLTIRDEIEVLTYHDLPWGNDYDYQNAYPGEFKRWMNQRSKHKIYILIQHDVDRRPIQTTSLLNIEAALNFPSNVMMFNKLVDRGHLKQSGEVQYECYDVDIDYWKSLEAKGFVFGYHCNAYEQSRFNMSEASKIFKSDLNRLRQHFNINFFSPHGGVAGPDGLNNHSLLPPDKLNPPVRWIHNRFGPRFHGNYSDGGLNNPKRDPESKNLLSFVRSFRPGRRYRILIHPQYFSEDCNVNKKLSQTSWYREVLAFYGAQPQKLNYWHQFEYSWYKRERRLYFPFFSWRKGEK